MIWTIILLIIALKFFKCLRNPILVGLFILALQGYHYYCNQKVVREGVVIVTGASSGIGYETTFHLAERGFHVFAGVRADKDIKALNSFAKTKKVTERVHPILLDVNVEKHVDDAEATISKFLKEKNLYLVGLVNNAGIDLVYPFEFHSLDYVKKMFDTNVFGVMRLCQKFIPELRRSTDNGRTARIVQISSILGYVTLPYTTGYSSSKHALESISNGLRVELMPWNIQTIVVQPGYIVTQITNNMKNNVKSHTPSVTKALQKYYPKFLDELDSHTSHGLSPTDVARVIHTAIAGRHPFSRYVIADPMDKYLSLFAHDFLSDYLQDLVAFFGYY